MVKVPSSKPNFYLLKCPYVFSAHIRHTGHFDHLLYESFSRKPSGFDLSPLEIGGAVFSIDTTNSTANDYSQLIQSIRKEIAHSIN